MSDSDADCVRACLDGHPEAFRQLVTRYEAPLVRYLIARIADEGEGREAAQEAFVRAYFNLAKLKRSESFFAWLVAIGDRVVKEMARSARRQRAGTNAWRKAFVERQTAQPVSDSQAAVARAVVRLEDPYREVIILRFYRGRSCAEIGERLGISLGTVTSRLSRAYSLLRGSLRGHPDFGDETP
jgi:RNA polymerase sigma-70 factor, ECF subfamily